MNSPSRLWAGLQGKVHTGSSRPRRDVTSSNISHSRLITARQKRLPQIIDQNGVETTGFSVAPLCRRHQRPALTVGYKHTVEACLIDSGLLYQCGQSCNEVERMIQSTIATKSPVTVPTTNAPTPHEFVSLREILRDDEQFEHKKLLSHRDRINDFLANNTVIPVTLEIDPTVLCNDKCPNCVHGFAHANRSLSLEHIDRILKEAKQMGVKAVTITGGGDPMCHPEFRSILEILRKHGIPCGMFTNGSNLRSSLADEVLGTFDWVRVSLDSATEEAFRLVRGQSGFNKRLEILEKFARKKAKTRSTCEIGVSFLTLSPFAEEIPLSAKLVYDMGYDYVQFKPMIMFDRPTHHHSHSASQTHVFENILKATLLSNKSFKVLMSGNKYAAEMRKDIQYSAFHCANFIASVAPSKSSTETMPELFLDCSAKYITKWSIGTFESFEEIIHSKKREQMIASVNSDKFCIASEKHATYNLLLEELKQGSKSNLDHESHDHIHHADWL